MAEADSDQLVAGFEEFVKLSAAGKTLTDADKRRMNSKAAGKLAKDALPKEVQHLVDSSVFPVFKEKGKQHMELTRDSCEKFVMRCAHEYCKVSTPTIKADDDKVKKKAAEIRTKIINTAPKKKSTAISKKGNVEGLTDTSKYTGSHVNRFDAEGKGKGRDGRENLHEHTGYVGQYKGKDTFDKKH